MTDPMPTIENILGFPARTNTPDHRKIAENMLVRSTDPDVNDDTKRFLVDSANVHATLATDDDIREVIAQLVHLHGDIGALPQSHHFAAGRL